MQERLYDATNAGADFNLGCSGFIYGLAMFKGFIAAGCKIKMLVCGETYSKALNKNDKGNRIYFGDAASACLISSEKKGYGAEILIF
jgi:3-oxoacyl-[acyl-carrier-protein] synthase-3